MSKLGKLATLMNPGIGRRIALLAFISLTGVIIISIASIYSFQSIKSSEARYADGANLKILATQINAAALNMRRAEKDFLLRKDTKYAKRYHDHATHVMALLKQVPKYTTDKAELEIAASLEKSTDNHAREFDNVSNLYKEIGLTEKQGLEGNMRNSVHAIESALKLQKSNADLMVKMLMMRRHEKDYIMRKKMKYLDRINSRQKEFLTLLKNNHYPKSIKNDLTAKLNSYVSSFRAYVKETQLFKRELANLSIIYAAMEPKFTEIAKHADKILAISSREMESVRTTAVTTVGLLSLILLTVVSAISWFITRSITAPLTRLKSSVEDITKGEYEHRVPGQQRKDELGNIASALDILRLGALKRVELEKEAEEARIAQSETEKKRQIEAHAAEKKLIEEEIRLKEEAEEKRLADRLDMAEKFENRISGILNAVSSAATELNATSESMNNSANSMKQESISASAATYQAGENVQLVASASEEMTASVAEISNQIGNASKASADALSSVQNASEKVNYMADSSDKINEIILLINDIAEQTNLLALNATIEAARA